MVRLALCDYLESVTSPLMRACFRNFDRRAAEALM